MRISFFKWPVRRASFDVWKAPWGLYSPHDKLEKKSLVNFSLVTIQTRLAVDGWLMADSATDRERQLTTASANRTTGLTSGRRANWHRRSCLVLSARFPVVNWRSRSVAKSAINHPSTASLEMQVLFVLLQDWNSPETDHKNDCENKSQVLFAG